MPINRIMQRLGGDKKGWWTEWTDFWTKLEPLTQYKIAAGGMIVAGVFAKMYSTDFKTKYNEARLVYEVYLTGGIEGLTIQWLEDATGVRPASLTKEGLEDFAARVVGVEAGGDLGLTIDSVWPFADVAATVFAEVLTAVATGKASRLINEARANKWARIITSFYNKLFGFGTIGASLKPQSRKRMLAAERQRRYRERRRMYVMMGRDAELDNIINECLQEIAAARLTVGPDGFANRWDAERALQ